MKIIKSVTLIIVIIVSTALMPGCVNILEEGPVEIITPHEAAPFVRPPTERVVVWNYDELVETILNFIMEFSAGGLIQYHHYEGEDVEEAVQQAIGELLNHHPIGAYFAADITYDVAMIVSYFEVAIEIEYERTLEQFDAIIPIPTQRYLMSQLLTAMSRYDEETLFRTGLNLTEDDIIELVREIYYDNPGRIVALPFVTVDFFPEAGDDRILEIKFSQIQPQAMMQQYGESLRTRIYDIADRVYGETDSEILLALANFLIEAVVFDLGFASTMSIHGSRHSEATAFGALVEGIAVGEGFAMAFNALSSELGLNSRIVLGHLDGVVHAWNIVLLYGDFYHIDIAASSIDGLEVAFLRTDEDFEEMLYKWDRTTTVRAEGSLTPEDILPPVDPDNYEDESGDSEEEEEENG